MAWGTIALTARPRTPLPARMTLPPTLACGSPACIVAADHSRAPMRSPRARLPEPSEPLICQVESRGGGRGRDAHSLLSAPRTEPYVRLSRIRLPPWVCDGKTLSGPEMEDFGFREPGLGNRPHLLLGDTALLAATAEHVPPSPSDLVPEHYQCMPIGRHRMVVEVASNHLHQPFPLRGDVLMHAPPQCLLDLPELALHSIASGLALDQELAPPRLAADEREAQEVEGLRLAEPTAFAVCRRKAPELDQPGLLRVQ